MSSKSLKHPLIYKESGCLKALVEHAHLQSHAALLGQLCVRARVRGAHV